MYSYIFMYSFIGMYSYIYIHIFSFIYIIQVPGFVFTTMLGFEPRTLYIVIRHCTTELYPQLSKCTLVTYM